MTPLLILTGQTFYVPTNSQSVMVRRIVVQSGAGINVAANAVLVSAL
jgi:hypothetical protein